MTFLNATPSHSLPVPFAAVSTICIFITEYQMVANARRIAFDSDKLRVMGIALNK